MMPMLHNRTLVGSQGAFMARKDFLRIQIALRQNACRQTIRQVDGWDTPIEDNQRGNFSPFTPSGSERRKGEGEHGQRISTASPARVWNFGVPSGFRLAITPMKPSPKISTHCFRSSRISFRICAVCSSQFFSGDR